MPRRKYGIDGKELLEYLMSRTQESATGCCEWIGPLQENGYAKIWYAHEYHWAHRVVYKLANGIAPEDMHVLHKCDNRKCLNPKHLSLGTQADNMLDASIKGRCAPNAETLRKISMNRSRKLSPSSVMAIRAMSERGEKATTLAEEFNVHVSMVHMIVSYRSWKDL